MGKGGDSVGGERRGKGGDSVGGVRRLSVVTRCNGLGLSLPPEGET